jgi:uncharacterized protein (DUF2236 family)
MSESRYKVKQLIKQIQELTALQRTLAANLQQSVSTHAAYLAAVGDFSPEFKESLELRLREEPPMHSLSEVFDATLAAAKAAIADGVRPFNQSETVVESPLVSLK